MVEPAASAEKLLLVGRQTDMRLIVSVFVTVGAESGAGDLNTPRFVDVPAYHNMRIWKINGASVGLDNAACNRPASA